jgi:hypothetical protein
MARRVVWALLRSSSDGPTGSNIALPQPIEAVEFHGVARPPAATETGGKSRGRHQHSKGDSKVESQRGRERAKESPKPAALTRRGEVEALELLIATPPRGPQ